MKTGEKVEGKTAKDEKPEKSLEKINKKKLRRKWSTERGTSWGGVSPKMREFLRKELGRPGEKGTGGAMVKIFVPNAFTGTIREL